MENNPFCQSINKNKCEKLTVAAFDFDGTMTKDDSLIHFLRFTSGNFKTFFKLAKQTPNFILYGLRFLSRQQLKEKLLKSFFKGMPIDLLRLEGEAFAKNQLPKLVKKDALAKLNMHLERGDLCILISANLDVYLEFFAKNNQFQECLCTKVAYDEKGLVTGALQGLNCRNAEKVHRLEALLGGKQGYTLYAYGDSDGDKELLAHADYPFYRIFKG